MSAVAVVAFFALVVLPRTSVPLLDGDVWWHLRAGETVLDTGRVPTVDAWAIVGDGMRWISQDWLTNAAMASVLRLGGSLGMTLLSLLFAGLVVLAFALLWVAIGRRTPRVGWLSRLVWLTLGLIVAGPIAGVRVQTIDLVMSALAAFVLWSYLADRRVRWLVALPLISVAWVNLHAGWPLLMALIGGVVVGEAGDRLVARGTGRAPLAWSEIRRLALAGLVALLAVAVNPNGLAMFGYPFETASIAAHRDFIFEWSRPDLSSFPGQMIFVLVLVAVIPTIIVARRTMPLADALWLVGLAAMALTAVRFALLAGPICTAIAAIHLSPRIAAWQPLTSAARVAARMDRPPRGGLGAVNALLVGVVLVAGVAVAAARVTPDVQAREIGAAMPEAAAAWLRTHDPAARIFNVYAWGGYLGRELPAARVYIDGRSDIYGDAPIRAYARAISLADDPAPLLAAADVDAVVFWPTSGFANWLDAHGWRRVHADPVAVIWMR
jgi:hypothetical protein